MSDVFHEGERIIQDLTGEADLADAIKGLIMPAIPRGAVPFVEKQPTVIVASKNAAGEPWASLLIGQPGFVKVPDAVTIQFDTRKLISHPADIFFNNLGEKGAIGILFIELDTRKRWRVNGMAQVEGPLISVHITQAYPNCPKYIQRRVFSMPEYYEEVVACTVKGDSLSPDAIAWISNADTLFVASAGTDGSLDASHRGGNAGFVQVMEDNVLKIPDYPGNSLFNTFGNMVQQPRTGLLFVDFAQQQTLQLTGEASLLFDQTGEDDLLRTKGTGRYWLFKPQRWIQTLHHHNVDWTFLQYSPYNP